MQPFKRIAHRFALSLALSALFLSASFAHADQPAPRCHMLSVGVNAYRARTVPDLKGCVNDGIFAAQQFRRQEGRLFQTVTAMTLLDQDATRVRVERGLKQLASTGRAGDWYVLFLSGHGSRRGGHFSFLPHDFDPARPVETSLSDTRILAWARQLIEQGKKVVVILDACYAGQIRESARTLLERRARASDGGLILMVSSMPNQTSRDLGRCSAFARAVGEGIGGSADLNGDGIITLRELRHYVYHRVHEMVGGSSQQAGAEQDCDCDYSLTISDSLPVALTR
jgi:uncharacterized caspase-like protein